MKSETQKPIKFNEKVRIFGDLTKERLKKESKIRKIDCFKFRRENWTKET
jgi:hypothetical protein